MFWFGFGYEREVGWSPFPRCEVGNEVDIFVGRLGDIAILFYSIWFLIYQSILSE